MRRSSRWRTARRGDSRRTANDTGRPGPQLIAVPDGDGRLSEGLLIEGSLVARVLKLRLLRIDARLVVAPAQMKAPPGAAPDGRRLRPRAVGTRLAAAQRLLEDP